MTADIDARIRRLGDLAKLADTLYRRGQLDDLRDILREIVIVASGLHRDVAREAIREAKR